MFERKCQANDPNTCPYHGVKLAYERSIRLYEKEPTPANFDKTIQALDEVNKLNTNKKLKKQLLSLEKKNTSQTKIVFDNFGNKRWLFEGKLHRVDGPAIEHDGSKK